MSNKLTDLFGQLKTTIVGTKTANIDSILDKAVSDIITYKSHSGRNGYIDLVKTVISKSSTDISSLGNSNLFSQGHTGPASLGQGGRIARYKIYESIVANINYTYRALSVLVDNILSPDDITKIVLDIKIKNYLEDELPTESKINKVKDVIKKLKLEKKLRMIIWDTLQNGDFFCEIAPLKEALSSRSIINESNVYKQHFQNKIINGDIEEWQETINKKQINIRLNYESLTEGQDEYDNKEIDPNKKLANISLIYHKPSLVVKLQSSLFPICFGYLIFPEIKGTTTYGSQFEDDGINNICMSILNNLGKKIPQMAEFNDNEELTNIVKYMIVNANPSKALDIRYVPPDKITHFMIPSSKYYPYGESILDPSQFTAKVLMALETALAVQRLAKSTEKRKIAVEVGLPRDAKKVIEGMKEEFRKRKVSLDSFGTIDTIPSMITTFEDIYIPQKDGKPFVDISTFTEGNADIRSKVDELKFMRDQLISSYGVPPSFLSIEENLCIISTTYIPLLNGYSITLDEIIKQYEKGDLNIYVYSYDHKTGKLVPGKVTWAGYTRLQTKCIRVHLDNKNYIDCTPDHPFMLRDGTYKEAQYLKENESLMPFYTRNTKTYTSKGLTYEMIYHPGIDKWQLTYQSVNEVYNKKKKGYVVHHDDYNPRNNHPENLNYITNIEHAEIHGYDKIRSGSSIERNKSRICDFIINDICKICGTSFERKYNQNKVTCSKECLKEYRKITGKQSYEKRKKNNGNKLRPDLKCLICGKPAKESFIELSDKRYNKLKNIALYCNSDSCKKRSKAVSILTKKGTKLFCDISYKKCEICKNIIINSPDKKTMLNVCSLKCMNTILSRRGAKKKKLQSRKKFICPICGDTFEKPKWYISSLKNSPCCDKNECKHKHHSNIRKDQNKNNWTTTICTICNEEFKCTKLYKKNTLYPCCDKNECKQKIWYTRNKENKRTSILNHKVTKIELLEGLHDTGDLTIEKYHNFAVGAGVIVHNSNKAALSEENILFARTVIGHQKYLSEQLTELIEKVFYIIDPKESLTLFDSIDIHLPTPKILQYEREARYMNDLVGLIENLERIGIPKEYSTKKYISNIDWKEVKKYEIDNNIDKTIDKDKDDNMQGGF